MLVYRSISVGLLAACAVLLAQAVQQPPVQVTVAAPHAAATIIDVAPGVVDVTPLIALAPGERVVAVDDRPVSSELAAGAAIRAATHRYIDVTTTQRRVLVLRH